MSGHYLPLATIAWGISIFYVFGNLDFLGGNTGMGGIAALSFFAWELRNERHIYYLIWLIVLVSLWMADNLLDSRPGRAVRALRGGLEMAEAFGVDAGRLKIVVFVYAALLACISGWLYAHLQRFVNPTPFGINQGIEYLFMAVVGGAGSVWGAVVGATLITLLKQLLQSWLPQLLGREGNFEVVVFGILMILLLQRTRDGVWPWLARLLPGEVVRTVVAAAALPRRARPRGTAPLLTVERARKEFGGLVAVRRSLVRDPARRDSWPDRAERRRQEHDVQSDQWRAVAKPRDDHVQWPQIGGQQPFQIARLGIGRTFQHVKLIAGMSVLDNVAIGAYLRGRAGVARAALRLDRREEARVARRSDRANRACRTDGFAA